MRKKKRNVLFKLSYNRRNKHTIFGRLNELNFISISIKCHLLIK